MIADRFYRDAIIISLFLFFLSFQYLPYLYHLMMPFLTLTQPTLAYASDEPFTDPANWGGVGLLETPTARVMKENTFRVGVSQIDPYRNYYITLNLLKGLEITGRVTEIIGVKVKPGDPKWQGYGNYKDKSVAIKYQFIEDGMYLPAISIGIMDPHGTRLYPSQYIVASKQIYPFDFTLGFGNGRFGKRQLSGASKEFYAEMFQDPKEWLKDSQFFGGVQLAIGERYALMLEYNPIRYERQTRDPAQREHFQEPVKSKLNYGFRWKPFRWADIDMSYQRGDTVGINLSTAFEIGQPVIPIYDHPYKERPEDRLNPMERRFAKALYESGFSNIRIKVDGDDLIIVAENTKYYYSTKAIGVILRLVHEIAPKDMDKVRIILTKNEIPIFDFSLLRMDIDEYFKDRLTFNELYFLSKIDSEVTDYPDSPLLHKRYFGYGLKPDFQTFLNDPSGFFKYKLGLATWVSLYPWKGATITGGVGSYLINNISTSNTPAEDPIRTDIVDYDKRDFSVTHLFIEQIEKGGYNTYGRLSLGLLETQYAGLDWEIARPFKKGRFMVGISGSSVKKRDPASPFKLSDIYKKTYNTLFLNTRVNIPKIDISIDLKTGRFLAGDKGTRVTVSKFINGVILSAWYSFTNTSFFHEDYNRGYHDKGVAVVIPLRLFKGSDTKTTYHYGLSPWTRDVAQDIGHFNGLFDFIGRDAEIFLDKDKGMGYK